MEGVDPKTSGSDGESLWVFPKLEVEEQSNYDKEGKHQGVKQCDHVHAHANDRVSIDINPSELLDDIPSQDNSSLVKDDLGWDEALRVKRHHYLFLATFAVAVFLSMIGRLTYDCYDNIHTLQAKVRTLENIQFDSSPSVNRTEYNTPSIIVFIVTKDTFKNASFASFSSFDTEDEMRITDQSTHLDVAPMNMKNVMIVVLCHTPTYRSLRETTSNITKKMKDIRVRSFHCLQEFQRNHSSIGRQIKKRILIIFRTGQDTLMKSMDIMRFALHDFLREHPSMYDNFSFYRDKFKTSCLSMMSNVTEVITKFISDPKKLKEACCVVTMNAKAALVHSCQRFHECMQSIHQVLGDLDFHKCMQSINEALGDIDYPVGL